MKAIRFAQIFLLIAILPVSAWAGIDIGPPVGSTAPALHALDKSGKAVTLADVSGTSGLVLVFVRSAAWCPFCQKQMIDLKAAQGPLAQRGYALAALSYDAPEVLAAFAVKQGIGYALLSDEKSAIIDAYGIRDPQYPPTSRAYGVPKPGIFVIDSRGVIRAKLAEEGYKNRPPVESLIEALDGIGAIVRKH